jgi:hypothetical protein
MNRRQKGNQRILIYSLKQARLITSLYITNSNVIEVRSVAWEEYWGYTNPFTEETRQLKTAWNNLIEKDYPTELRTDYVQAYFTLLHTCLACSPREINIQLLRKIVAFETFHIADARGHFAAGTFNFRNPVYLLSRIVNPSSPDDPKYLPLLCPMNHSSEETLIYGHYRRIPLHKTKGLQLFIYPPIGTNPKLTSYSLIGRLFTALTQKTDPWVKVRTRSLFRRVFAPLVARLPKNKIQLLDLACGSAKISTALCRKAFAKYHKSFDLTLIDVVRVKRSLAKVFHRNPSVFGNVIFCQNNLFDWVEQTAAGTLPHFDIIIMLRICDVFSSLCIEKMSFLEAKILLDRDGSKFSIDADTLSPAKLMKERGLERIQHGIKQFRFRKGRIFQQFSLSDYFKAIYLITTGNPVDEDCMIYIPIRRFDDSALTSPNGQSLIGQLMNMTDRIIIEDRDLSSSYLQQHLEKNGLKHLCIREIAGRRGMRGAPVCLIHKRFENAEKNIEVIQSTNNVDTRRMVELKGVKR